MVKFLADLAHIPRSGDLSNDSLGLLLQFLGLRFKKLGSLAIAAVQPAGALTN